MNSNIKFYLILGGVALFLGIGFVIFILFFSGRNSDDTLIAKTKSGDVKIRNFLKEAKLISGTAYLADDPSYSIVFSQSDNNFTITLTESTRNALINARQKSEEKLLSILQIEKADACKLAVHEYVPSSFNEQYSYLDYGLSFCSNALNFDPENAQTQNPENLDSTNTTPESGDLR